MGTYVRMQAARTRYTEAQAREAVAASRSYAEALRRLGMCVSGWRRRSAAQVGPGCGASSVEHFDPYWAARNRVGRDRHADSRRSWSSTPPTRGRSLKRRLYREGLKRPECELCGQDGTWRGQRMALILDHINGVATDNRIENLGSSARTVPQPSIPTAAATCSFGKIVPVRRCGGAVQPALRETAALLARVRRPPRPDSSPRTTSSHPEGRASQPRPAGRRPEPAELRRRRPQVRRLGQRRSEVVALVRAGRRAR